MREELCKHLEMIQGVITRMATNSFLVRGWSITLVSALFALSDKDADRSFVLISYFPCGLFWFLDAFYLSQERRYRALYDSVRLNTGPVDFNMNAPSPAGTGWIAALFSSTMVLFHGAMALAILAVAVLIKN